MAANRLEQGLSKRVRAAEVAASIDPWDGLEAPKTTDKSKTDRFNLIRRLRKLETACGLAGSAAAIKLNNSRGPEHRLRAIEATQ